MINMDAKIKHLEMIQQIIKRMSSNCLHIKGSLIAIISASFIFFNNEYSEFGFLASVFLTIGFSLFDAKYLQYERKYRELYNIVRKSETIDFSMDINIDEIKKNNKTNYINCLKSCSIVIPYIMLFFYNILLLLLSKLC